MERLSEENIKLYGQMYRVMCECVYNGLPKGGTFNNACMLPVLAVTQLITQAQSKVISKYAEKYEPVIMELMSKVDASNLLGRAAEPLNYEEQAIFSLSFWEYGEKLK